MTNKKRRDLSRWAPPGQDLDQLLDWFRILLALSLLCCTCGFLLIYLLGHGNFTARNTNVFPTFSLCMAGKGLFYSFLGPLLIITQIGVNYRSFRKDSMSIYLMRRLPDQRELHRRCWTLPLLALAQLFVLKAINVISLFAIYHVFAPEGAISGIQWVGLLEVLL